MAMKSAGRAMVTFVALGLLIVKSAPAQMPFRTSLVAGADSKSYGVFLQSITVHWAPSTVEHRYRVQRATAPGGPWVTDHEVEGLSDTVRRLPPNVPVYLRVVALHQVAPTKWEGTDTTNSTVTATPRSTLNTAQSGLQNMPGLGGLTCKQSNATMIKVTWGRIRDASHYRVLPVLNTSTGIMNLASIAAQDTTITLANLPSGSYRMSVEPQYDIANWPTSGQSLTMYGPEQFRFQLTASAGQVTCH